MGLVICFAFFLVFNRRSVDKNVAIERKQLNLQSRQFGEATLSVGSKVAGV